MDTNEETWEVRLLPAALDTASVGLGAGFVEPEEAEEGSGRDGDGSGALAVGLTEGGEGVEPAAASLSVEAVADVEKEDAVAAIRLVTVCNKD